MHNSEARRRKERQKEQIKQRYNVVIDPENYEYIPAKKQADYYDNDVNQRVAIYVRVSTDDVRQTTSYELQKKYYEEFVTRHPNWTLVNIYADEGISGTSLKHRDEFNRMIADCKAGKIDMIVTKSVSRFARNVEDFIGTVRSLAERRPPVGVFFESEAIFSLNDDSQMALTFQATMAEEESHTRSRSMETSLRMRLDHGVPLTPKLFGYTHDEDGHLQINPDEAPTVKLIIRDLLESYGLSLGTRKAPCVICAVSTLEQIYQTHGYHMLSRVLRLCAGTWEGDENSFSANILNGITRLVYTFGNQLNDEVFKERVGALSIKQLVRMSKERCPGSMGYAEAMLLEYNGKKKNISQRLSMNKLHMQGTAGLCSLLSDVDTSSEAATAEGVSE